MVTLVTTAQQIRTGLKRAPTENDRFALIMRAVYRIVMKKNKGLPSSNVQYTLHPSYTTELSFRQRGGTKWKRKASVLLHINLVKSPDRARYQDLHGSAREPAAIKSTILPTGPVPSELCTDKESVESCVLIEVEQQCKTCMCRREERVKICVDI
jgi:hypothetical protein